MGSSGLQETESPGVSAPSNRTNVHTTEESITTLEEESWDSGSARERARAVAYTIEGQNVIIEGQVTDPRLFHYIAKQYQEDASEEPRSRRLPLPVLRESNRLHDPQHKKRKQQVSVRYKRPDRGSRLLGREDSPSPLHKLNFADCIGDRLSVTIKSEEEMEQLEGEVQKLSLTCQNPIAIIHNLSYEKGKTEGTAQSGDEQAEDPFITSDEAYSRPHVQLPGPLDSHLLLGDGRESLSPGQGEPQSDETLQEKLPRQRQEPSSNLQKQSKRPSREVESELNELMMQNYSLQQQAKEHELLFESKTYSLECQKDTLRQELQRAHIKSQLLEEENAALALHLGRVPQSTMAVNTSFSLRGNNLRELGLQTDTGEVCYKQTQTEGPREEQLVAKMKEEIAAQASTLARREKEKGTLLAAVERWQLQYRQVEGERNSGAKQRKVLTSELQALQQELAEHHKIAASLKADLKEREMKTAKLEAESRVLAAENGRLKEELALIEERSDVARDLAEKLRTCEQLSTRLGQELETQKRRADEASVRQGELATQLEEQRQVDRKRAEKIRELKKERDRLKVEALQLKQLFNDKCDNYREIRARLYQKLKVKDEELVKLQVELEAVHRRLKSVPEFSASSLPQQARRPAARVILDVLDRALCPEREAWHDEAPTRGGMGKATEGLTDGLTDGEQGRSKSLENTAKHALKDLSATLQLEELSGKLKKKLEDLLNAHGKNSQSEPSPEDGSGSGPRPSTPLLQPSTDKAITENPTEKCKSFCSDETNAFMEAKNVLTRF